MVKKSNKVLYISIVSISVIIIGIVVWGFLTNWKFWNYKKEKKTDPPKLPKYKSNMKIPEGNEIEMKDPKKKGFKIGQEIEIGTEIRTIVGFKPSKTGLPTIIVELDSKISEHPPGTIIQVIKQTPDGKFSTKYCQKYNKDGSCQTCFSNLPLKNGICIPSDNCKPEKKCKKCNKIGKKCEKCDDGYIPVNDGKCCLTSRIYQEYINNPDGTSHAILKCCDTDLCDGKCCDTNKNCLTKPDGTTKVCCDGNTVSNDECCGKDQILDKYGKCCDKGKKDKYGKCCNHALDSGVCKIKCGDSDFCDLDKKCENNVCISKKCIFGDEKYSKTLDGDNADNVNNCKLKDIDGLSFENNTCKYPVYKWKTPSNIKLPNIDKNIKFLYTIPENNSIVNSNLTTTTEQTGNHSCNGDDFNTENCIITKSTNYGSICSKKKNAPVIPENQTPICPYEDTNRCCKLRKIQNDTVTYGKFTGQVCDEGEYCRQDVNFYGRLGTCYKKYCKEKNKLPNPNHLDCSKHQCGDAYCYGKPVCKKTTDNNGISYSYCTCDPPETPSCKE